MQMLLVHALFLGWSCNDSCFHLLRTAELNPFVELGFSLVFQIPAKKACLGRCLGSNCQAFSSKKC